jgi:IgA-specific serine endopeptidase
MLKTSMTKPVPIAPKGVPNALAPKKTQEASSTATSSRIGAEAALSSAIVEAEAVSTSASAVTTLVSSIPSATPQQKPPKFREPTSSASSTSIPSFPQDVHNMDSNSTAPMNEESISPSSSCIHSHPPLTTTTPTTTTITHSDPNSITKNANFNIVSFTSALEALHPIPPFAISTTNNTRTTLDELNMPLSLFAGNLQSLLLFGAEPSGVTGTVTEPSTNVTSTTTPAKLNPRKRKKNAKKTDPTSSDSITDSSNNTTTTISAKSKSNSSLSTATDPLPDLPPKAENEDPCIYALNQVQTSANKESVVEMTKYFKADTVDGYGYPDQFLGVRVPQLRR